MAGEVQACVDEVLAGVLPRGACDFVDEVAAQLPTRLVCAMMGVPKADHARISRYCAAFMGAQDPAYQIDGDELKTQRVNMRAVFDYMSALAMERRRCPANDFTSIIGNMESEGAPLSERDVGWWSFAVVVAGLETTRDALAVGFRELLLQPDQADRLRRDPKLLSLAVEEMVRWTNPAKHKFRIATRDVELGGRTIRAGDWVMCWLVSANRDERAFADPYRFDVGRAPNPHIAFGVGEHSCLGRHLARLEMQLMVKAVLERMPDMELAGEPEWLVSNNHTGLRTMPVRFTPSHRAAA